MIKPQLGEKKVDSACGKGDFIISRLGQLSEQVNDTIAQKRFYESICGIGECENLDLLTKPLFLLFSSFHHKNYYAIIPVLYSYKY